MSFDADSIFGSRARVGWWVVVLALAAGAAYIAWSFVGMLVTGVFGYYATRPIYHRVEDVLDSDGAAAGASILLVVVPVLLLLLYASVRAVFQLQRMLGNSGTPAAFADSYLGSLPVEQRQTVVEVLRDPSTLLSNPGQVAQTVLEGGLTALSAVFGAIVLIALALTLSYFLLKNQAQLSDGLVALFGGRDTTAYAYASAVDRDLESVFFGNLLFVVAMAVVASATYWGTNLVAPQGLTVPMVLVLGFLTGIASLVPIVVGKVVYLPVVAYLAFQATQEGGASLAFVGGVLVVYFLVLDILPQTFLQPYITGQKLDMVLLLFAYLLGPMLFGWYGFFLMPILFVLMVEAVRIVLPELVRGEPLTDRVSMGPGIGSDPRSTPEETSDAEVVVDDDDAAAGSD